MPTSPVQSFYPLHLATPGAPTTTLPCAPHIRGWGSYRLDSQQSAASAAVWRHIDYPGDSTYLYTTSDAYTSDSSILNGTFISASQIACSRVQHIAAGNGEYSDLFS